MEIIKELSVFNNIKYYDEPHTYYIDGEKTISCTGFIHKFEEDVESNVDKPDKWAEKQGHFYTWKINRNWLVLRKLEHGLPSLKI